MTAKVAIIFMLILSGITTSFLAVYGLKHRHEANARVFTALMAAISLYSLGYALEISYSDIAGIQYALRIEYLGLSFLPTLWIILALQYTGNSKILTSYFYLFIFIVPCFTLILHYTNDFHHLYYKDLSINDQGPLALAEITGGVWYWVNVAYQYLCLFVGAVVFLIWIRSSYRIYRDQAFFMLMASVIPWIGNLVYLLGLSPYGIDLVPFTFSVSGLFIALDIFKYHILNLTPIARSIIFEKMVDPVMVADKKGRMIDFNPAASRLFEHLDQQSIGTPISHIFPDNKVLADQILNLKSGEIELTVKAGNHQLLFLSAATLIPGKKHPSGIIISLHDVTRHLEKMNRLQELATVDPLTGVFNRRYFVQKAKNELNRSIRYKKPCSVIMIDLDHFKAINDTYGHAAGDQVLISTSIILKNGIRDSDILARYGGEEFVIFLPETDKSDAFFLADRLRTHVEEAMVSHQNQHIGITASFGVFGFDQTYNHDIEIMLAQSDQALYAAKKNGRNRVEILSDGLTEDKG